MAWKYGKKWVYSITYDEGCEDLLRYALPVHRRYGIPGHVALVASQVGVRRNVPGSSYDGMKILSKQQIHDLVSEGWGVSCHSLTHCGVTFENGLEEVVRARHVLENALEMEVRLFCVPGDNTGYPAARAFAEQAGYKGILTIYDRVNLPSGDLFNLGRVPLHSEYPPPFYSAYDPYKRIHQAIDLGGWIIDYCHCPMPDKPVHPAKDCTTQELEQRFEKVCQIGGSDVWLAEPNEVADWVLSNPSLVFS
ncbi:MAG TPA: polysaccharide deacetylase family protein [Candidatus Hydrogenedentes bacterium]|nr:polysaccharide deacetylase family protein [Candidatus Hydrogenedentota bacterium]HOL78077.1 polysaccharide deacetylase family protein [Candidatus Hydrogenedentota bacterium]HPO86931.1 polysaccharide deacetylase family protein [Candidatus Hydrogenedentota bacterium]